MQRTLLVIFVALITNTLWAQTTPSLEFNYQPYYLKGDSALSLEKVEGRIDDKPGFGGFTQYANAFGAKSNLRFKKGEVPTFVIGVETGVDPLDVIELAKAQVKGDRRRFEQFSMSLYKSSKDPRAFTPSIKFKKIADGLYQIQIAEELQPGEYAFTLLNTSRSFSQARSKLFCFGVD